MNEKHRTQTNSVKKENITSSIPFSSRIIFRFSLGTAGPFKPGVPLDESLGDCGGQKGGPKQNLKHKEGCI